MNGIAGAFDRTLKRDYIRVNPGSMRESSLHNCPARSPIIMTCNRTVYPHRALGYRCPREFHRKKTARRLSAIYGATTGRTRVTCLRAVIVLN